jgi:hypothetical protein
MIVMMVEVKVELLTTVGMEMVVKLISVTR